MAEAPGSGLLTVSIGMRGLPVGMRSSDAIWNELPHAVTLYLADQAHVPYGMRPEAEVRDYAAGITRYLLEGGAEIIVVACNFGKYSA